VTFPLRFCRLRLERSQIERYIFSSFPFFSRFAFVMGPSFLLGRSDMFAPMVEVGLEEDCLLIKAKFSFFSRLFERFPPLSLILAGRFRVNICILLRSPRNSLGARTCLSSEYVFSGDVRKDGLWKLHSSLSRYSYHSPLPQIILIPPEGRDPSMIGGWLTSPAPFRF